MSRTDAPREGGERALSGLTVVSGVAVGRAHCTHEGELAGGRTIAAAEVEPELARLDNATKRSRDQLSRLGERLLLLPEDVQRELAPLLDAYRRMLGSERLRAGMRRRIRDELVSAETAVDEEIELAARRLLALPHEDADSLVRRADEVREIGRRLRRNLLALPFRTLGAAPRGSILVADRLSPAEIALLDPTRIAGVITEGGGAIDHTAVMLASLGLPAIVGVHGIVAGATEGDVVVLDGVAGVAVLRPTPAREAAGRDAAAREARERHKLGRLRRLPARLGSGEDVELQANIDLLSELPFVGRGGATGIGLLRTEFLFLASGTLPNEAAQADAYRAAIRAMGGDTTTIRLLDWGNEKEGEAMARRLGDRPRDANPALAVRGVRLLLADPELLDGQLGAILAAAADGAARILVPMVTAPGELARVRVALARAARRLRRRGTKLPPKLPPLGAMIEVPAAALMADAIALEADFLSIGTNDLAMYTLAADRAATEMAPLYDPLQPAVLRLIAGTVEAALRLRRPVSICGELAGNPHATALLLGLGLRSFSMNPSAVPRVKATVRELELDACLLLARDALQQPHLEGVQKVLGLRPRPHPEPGAPGPV